MQERAGAHGYGTLQEWSRALADAAAMFDAEAIADRLDAFPELIEPLRSAGQS